MISVYSDIEDKMIDVDDEFVFIIADLGWNYPLWSSFAKTVRDLLLSGF